MPSPRRSFVFLPAGDQPVSFFKAIQDAGIMQSGIKVYGTGDVTNETAIDAIGDPILGITTTYFLFRHARLAGQQRLYQKLPRGDGRQAAADLCRLYHL